MTTEEAGKYGLDKPQGAVISRLDPKGAFAKAGLEVSDVIMGIGDMKIDGVDAFIRLVDALPAGQKVPFMVLDHRTGEIGSAEVTIR